MYLTEPDCLHRLPLASTGVPHDAMLGSRLGVRGLGCLPVSASSKDRDQLVVKLVEYSYCSNCRLNA